ASYRNRSRRNSLCWKHAPMLPSRARMPPSRTPIERMPIWAGSSSSFAAKWLTWWQPACARFATAHKAPQGRREKGASLALGASVARLGRLVRRERRGRQEFAVLKARKAKSARRARRVSMASQLSASRDHQAPRGRRDRKATLATLARLGRPANQSKGRSDPLALPALPVPQERKAKS